MEYTPGKKTDTFITAAVFAVMSLALSMGAVFYGVSLGQALIFCVFQVFGILIPGMAFTLLLAGKNTNSALSFLCMSYAFGYALVILEYFVMAAVGIGRTNALIIQAVLTGFGTAIVLFRKNGAELLRPKGADLPFALVLLSFLALSFLAYGGNYPLPGRSRPDVSFHANALYWVENAVALTKSFPPQELRLSGSTLFYHYFASVYVAFSNLVTGIDCFSLAYSLYPLGKSLIVFGGLYELSGSFFPERKKQILFITAMLFSTGFENYTVANYAAQFLTLPFGFDISLAFGCYFIAFLMKQYTPVTDTINSELSFVFAALSILMCAGHKVPVALVFLVFAGVICLRWLGKKEIGKALRNGISAVFCFAAVMIVCVGIFSGADSRGNAGGFSHVAMLRATPLFDIYEEIALNRSPGLAGIVKTAAVYFIQMGKLIVLTNPLILFLGIHGVYVLFRDRNADCIDLALLLSALFGMFMGLFNAQEGVSQMYCTLAAYVPSLIFGIRHMNVYAAHTDPQKRNIAAGLASGILLMQIMLFMGPAGVLETGWKGFFNANSIRYRRFQSEEPDPYSLQLSDYEALTWIRDNTPSDSILVADRSVLCDLDNYMYYGTFSERQMYIEGDRYFYGALTEQRDAQRETTRMIYANSYGDLLTAAENGADYVIQTRWVSPYFTGTGCSKVFSTDTVNVWKIDIG